MNDMRLNSADFPKRYLLLVIVLSVGWLTPLLADKNTEMTTGFEDHTLAVEAWRDARHARLVKPDGWLTLVGLDWLEEGENRIGSASDNDIKLSGGPPYWGMVVLRDGQLSFKNLEPENVLVNGEPLLLAELVADTEGDPTLISSGNLHFYAIYRAGYGIRVKDSQAKTLQNFKGIDYYPIEKSWLVSGRFQRAQDGATIEIANVLGQVSSEPVFGTFEFDRDGNAFSLIALGSEESENLWFIFSDRTSGHGTYGAGRFLYSNGMPENGRLTVDFNKAYNPPCAFNPWSTCPLPPQRNRLDLKVEAGEKDFHADKRLPGDH